MDFNSIRFEKEKSKIKAYNAETGVFLGGYDILNNVCIGKNGREIYTYPVCFNSNKWDNYPSYNTRAYDRNHPMPDNIYFAKLIEVIISSILSRRLTNKQCQFLESLISLRLLPESANALYMDEFPRLTKDFVNYIHNTSGYIFTYNTKDYYEYAALINKIMNDEDIKDMYKNGDYIIRLAKSGIPANFIAAAIKRCSNENIEYMFTPSFRTSESFEFIENYYKKSMELYGTANVERNMLVKYCEILGAYETYQNKRSAELIRQNNDKPELYFETDEFFIEPLLTPEAFHYEAEHQHNCVERLYMSKVVNGQTYIVTVRRKSAPAQTLITCEVTKQGLIKQFLLRNNQRVCDQTLITLGNLYQQHLYEVIGR